MSTANNPPEEILEVLSRYNAERRACRSSTSGMSARCGTSGRRLPKVKHVPDAGQRRLRQRRRVDRKKARGGIAMREDKDMKLNPKTTPLGVLLVANLPEDQAAVVAERLPTKAVVRESIIAEIAGRCRPAVLMALAERLSMLT